MTVYVEIGLWLSAFAILWFVTGIFRLSKLSASRDKYMEKFFEVCDDENIPLHFSETAQSVFKSGAQSFWEVVILGSFSKRVIVAKREINDIARMPPDSALRLGECYFLLLNHISYYTPILGLVMRKFVVGRIPRSATSKDGVILISAVDYLSHAT